MTALNFPDAVIDERDLYGRGEELDRITVTFVSGRRAPVVIIGERRVGKTSLYNVVRQRLGARDVSPRFVTFNIEPRGITTFTSFAHDILSKLITHLRSTAAAPFPVDIPSFELEFASLLQPGLEEMFVVGVDEFDEILRNVDDGDRGKILGLVSQTEQRLQPLRFLFTMTSVPDTLHTSPATPFTSMSELCEIGPLDYDTMAAMIRRLMEEHIPVRADDLDWFFELSGGHPYFAKLLLDLLLRQRAPSDAPDRVGLPERCVACLSAAVSDGRARLVLRNLYEMQFNEAQKTVLLLLALRQSPLDEMRLKQLSASLLTAARILVRRGYLATSGAEFAFHIDFLDHWLRNWESFDEECERLGVVELDRQLAESIEVEVDDVRGEVRVRGVVVKLSRLHHRILRRLAANAGCLVRRQSLVDYAWETRGEAGISDETVDQAIRRLRDSLGDANLIEVLRGQGFRLHGAVLISDRAADGEEGKI